MGKFKCRDRCYTQQPVVEAKPAMEIQGYFAAPWPDFTPIRVLLSMGIANRE
jgi:hypothetical protein